MSLQDTIAMAFLSAKEQHRELAPRWLRASFRVGSSLPNSLLVVSVQQCGDLDMLLRTMESEAASKVPRGEVTVIGDHYRVMLSGLWAGLLYQVHWLYSRRRSKNEAESQLLHDLRLLRVGLEKHEIAAEENIEGELVLTRMAQRDEGEEPYLYRTADPNRSQIMPTAISERGSVMWRVIDTLTMNSYWLERQQISDRFLTIADPEK